MRKFSFVLIILGIFVAAYPFLERGYTWYWQQKILEEYEAHEAVETTEYHQLQEIFEESVRVELPSQEEAQGDTGEQQGEQQQQESSQSSNQQINQQSSPQSNQEASPTVASVPPNKRKTESKIKAIGILKIPKIDLNLPILQGATEKNLKIGGAIVMGTTPLGEIGNTAIAGHRSHTYGRFFNRLDELEVGDELLVEKEGRILRYQIYKKHVVGPADTSVLNGSKEHRILTLITCHPLYKATHRLVVHAVYIE